MAAQAGNVLTCFLLPDSMRRPPEEEIQALEDEHQRLRTTVVNLSKEENPTFMHKCLTNQFRELSYDAEDYMEMLRHSGGGCWQINWILCKTKQQPHVSAKDISELRSRVKDADEIWKAYHQPASSRTATENSCWSCRLQAEPTQRISISSESLEPKGLDDPTNELVRMLAFDSNQLQLKVVSVHGSAGVGKTTLTRRLYHYYKGRFHYGAFLRVSRKPDTKRLLASLLLQIKGRQCKYRAIVDDQEDLIDNIKQHLQGKSYLIVIDDLWETSEWDILSRAFPRDNFCSRIITTTQVKAVALTCCNDHTEHIFNMRPLNDAESIELFNSRVNHIVGYNAEECKEVSYEIVGKFGVGLPLVIINIAGMLGGWPDIQMNELKYVRSFLFSALAANPSYERMEGVLTLVYNNLPPKLKTCLLYLSMFPEYYVIRKDDLVRQWVAEGIFREVHPQDEELIGNVYFDELLNRGLIQSADTDYNNQVVSCTVHHTVRDFIAQKALQENFITVVGHHETVAGLLDNKVRRLSVRFGDVKCAQIPESLQISLVRSLMFSGFFKCIPSLVEYWRLQVLILHIWNDRDRRILDLSVIGDLIHLRYVRVKCNMAVKLPAMIRGLQYLQTLDVNARVAAVPVDIFCLPHLLHLHIPSEPFLSCRSVHMFLLPCLNKQTNLLDLHLTCSAAVASSRIVSSIKCLSSILGRFTCLKSLILDGEASSDGSIISCDSLSSVAHPPPGLERLVLSPRIFMVSRLPDWIGDIRDTLCTLKIALRGLSDNDVGTLQQLNQLAALSLYVRTTPEERIIFNRGFQVLKFFKFVCTAPCLQFEREAMPEVETLKLRFSASTMHQYSLVQVGFEHMIALKLCSAKIRDAGADQVSREGAKQQMLSAFSKHPHPPVINIQLLESSIYNETGQSATDVIKRGGPDKQYGIRENDSTENINRTADTSRIITSPEYSSRVQKPGWVCRRPRNGVRLVKTVRGFTYVVRQHMKQPGFRLTNEVATLVQDMERLKVITDSSSPGSQPEEWVLQVQDLTYDIQDFIDIYSWLRIRSRRHTMAHMSHIVQLKDRIKTVRDWQQSGILSHGGSSGTPGSSGPPWSHPYADEEVFVGIEEPMSEILEILLLPEDFKKSILEPLEVSSSEGESVLELMSSPTEQHKPTVVSIVGYPGIGKTALARAVYNHPRVRSAFNNCVAWIDASECSNLADLQNKILKQVESNFYSTTLEGILGNKRFLVVIDGLQGAGMWYGIQRVFPKTHHGSRIIVTTSIQSVATTCSPERRYIYRMQGLDYLACEKLFWTRVGSRANRTHALECTLEDTLRKCGGLPLAVISVANHLCLKDQNLLQGSSGAFEEMNRVLTQSYDSLPDNGHRMCLLSLSTFPQGHLIKRKMLIRKWVAEGLALGDGELNPEQVASNIFDVLIDRNIIEPVLIGNNYKAKGCLVLGVIKDFIINKSVSKEFATIVSNDDLLFPNKMIARPVRRLFVNRGTTHSQRVAKGIGLDRVRSLRICNTVPFDFQDYCLLRVLDLEACQGIDKRVLHSICKLVFLKYLSLRGSDVYKISKKIKKLQCLEMLDIRETRVETLPIEVFMLPRLAHLFGKFELPRQLKDRTFRSKLQAFFSEKSRLQTLSGFVMVGSNEFEHIILKTRLLRKVKLWCNHTLTPSCQKHLWSSIQELLKGKNALESLSIDFGNESINFLNDIGAPYSLISSIKLRGRLISLPTFMTSHNTTLSQLELSSTRLSIEALSLLQSLRQLTYLKLVDGDGFWGDCFIVQSDGFPSLLRMCFEAPELPQVDIHQGGMRSLTCLQLLCPVFASRKNYDWGQSPMGVRPGEKLKVVDNNPKIGFKEISTEINSEEIEETVSMKRPIESIMETVLEQNARKNYPEKIKERFDLKKHFKGIEHLQFLSELVLHPSVSHEVFDAWKKETGSHVNKPKVTRRGGRSMVGKEEEHQCLKQKYEMLDKEPDTRLTIECGNKLGRGGRSMVGKEEEHQCLKQEYEMLDKEPDTRLSIECGNKLADIRNNRAHEYSSLSAATPDVMVALAKSVVEGAVFKALAVIEDKATLWQSTRNDLAFITSEFQMMQSFLSVADEERARNNVVRTWVRQVRDLAYKVEDCIEYVIHLDKTSDWYWRCLPGFIRPELPLDKALAEIKLLKGRVEEVSLRNMRYNLISDSGSKPVTRQQLVPGASIGATTFDMLIKARDTTKMQRGLGDLTKLLITKKPGGDLGVISLWAAGGNADTTPIIREAYCKLEICESFGCRGWAKLTHPFNPHEFRRSLLIQFHTNSCLQKKSGVDVGTLERMEVAGEGELIEEFMEQMKERYLVILENVSSMVEWDTVRAYLPEEKNHSWVIISTQKSEVARLCVGDPWQVFELKQSSAEHSVCVFFRESSQGDGDKSKQTTMLMANNNEASSSMGVQNNTDMWIGRFPLVKVWNSQVKDLHGYLAKACVNGFPVISVWGIAGVGKSALVKNLYYDIMSNSSNRIFTMYSWVDVSHPFNLRNLAWSLLSELQSDSPQQNGISNPIQECHELLEKHRCLVVIDGLQSTEEWDLIRHYLVSTHSRSIIVVITTEASIAIHCANREEAMYNVKSLDDDEAHDLFKKKVGIFTDSSALRDSEDPELLKLISKCGGLPKVIVAVANFLAPMTVSWMKTAMNLSDRFIHDLETKPEFDNLRGLFGWMHNYFCTCPDYLKPCILYLSIFPQGQSIRRRRLVRRWIAEGYSRDTSNRSAEDTGEKFFSMLLNLSIIQQTPHSVTAADTRMALCKVNGFFREYIISRQMDEDLVFELEGRCTLTSQRTGRHLVIKESWDRDKIVFSSIDFSRLRSLTVFGQWKPFFISETMKVLRVLDLENATGVTYKYLGQMVKVLPRLKFLSLRGIREICCLPNSFAALSQLETLDVRDTSIATLPPSITKLTKLQYIRAGTAKEPSVPCAHLSWLPRCCRACPVGGVEVPAGIEKLTALHTLGAVNVGFSGGKAILKEVKKLTQLHKLEVTGINKKNSNEFCSAISDHVHLESLSVWLSMGNNEHFSEDMFSTQENPLEKLQTLKLCGPLRSVPAWIKDLPKLTKLDLELEVTMSVQVEVNNVLRVLGEIKELRILRLCAKPLQDGDCTLNFSVSVAGVQDRCYRKVKVLEISCRSNLTVTFGSYSMENLELLSAKCCSGSVLKFTELSNLSVRKLKEVRYLGSLDDKHKEDMETQLNNHPKKPALNHVSPDGY